MADDIQALVTMYLYFALLGLAQGAMVTFANTSPLTRQLTVNLLLLA